MFWKENSLFQLDREQWESLCDRCGKCCLLKLHDEISGVIYMTSLSCSLLNTENACCSDYKNRQERVADCMVITPDNFEAQVDLLPSTCAYRLVYEGKDLPDWHPLITTDLNSTRNSGNSVVGRIRPINQVEEEEYESYLVDWPI